MTDDELIAQLRQTLHQEASGVTSPADAWERFEATAGPSPAPVHVLARRARVGVPAGIIGLAAAVLVAVLVTRGSSGPSSRVSSAAAPTTAAASAAARAPSTTAAAASAVPAAGTNSTASPGGASAPNPSPAAAFAPGGPVPKGFQAASVTFVSPSDGWLLGTAPCATAPCTSILRTTDGGRTWVGIAAPKAPLSEFSRIGQTASGVSSLRFADGRDGWAWGPDLWATHDGGQSWTQVAIPGAGPPRVYALEAGAGEVHAAVLDGQDGFRLATAPETSDAFALSPVVVAVGAGPVPGAQIVLQSGSGWMIEVDRTVVGGARLSGGTWQLWTPPCLSVMGPAVLAASSPTELVAACNVGLWSDPQGEQLFVSHDGGATWSDAGPIPLQNIFDVATASAATTVVSAAGSDGALVFEATFDGGRSWSTVYRGPANAEPVEIGFTTALQGVAVVTGPGQVGTLVMTPDGGHSWTAVTFP